jgi:outer membrane protein assembly factor BamB
MAGCGIVTLTIPDNVLFVSASSRGNGELTVVFRKFSTAACFLAAILARCYVCSDCLGAEASPPTAGNSARRILADTGVHGGLVVHLGCGDGKRTAALRATDRYLVHGLDTDAADVAEARKNIRAAGLYGRVSAETYDGVHLPYVDNLVSAIVVDRRCQMGDPGSEILRVLSPRGKGIVRETGNETWLARVPYPVSRIGDGWAKFEKPPPDDTDEWTHFLYDASNNAVSRDEAVGPPERLQWVTRPKFSRSHEHLASLSAAVASGGRIFSMEDHGPIESIAFPAYWLLVARDAYNGLTLWTRELGPWEWHLREFRHGPPQITRRLVAVDDRVYATLSYGGPVEAIDAATGETAQTYAGTEGAEEIVHIDGMLLVVVGAAKPARGADARRGAPGGSARRLLALDATAGAVVWENQLNSLAPVTLGAADGRAFYQDGPTAVAVDLKTGKQLWQSEPLAAPGNRPAWYSPVLVAYEDVILWADGKMLTGLDATTGKTLWQGKSEVNWHAPPDVLVSDGLVWTGQLRIHQQPGITKGLDPRSGEVKRTKPSDLETFACGMTHHRCYRNKGTPRWLVLGRAGAEFLNVATGDIHPHHWVRGTCQFGVMPANGLLYVPPHSCACFLTAKINGFNALAPRRRTKDKGQRKKEEEIADDSSRLEKGPAYADVPVRPSSFVLHPSDDWPTYRHDALRSGRASTSVPTDLKPLWRAELGGKLTPVTIAESKCFVAAVDAHTLHALDAETGNRVWTFTAGGRIDSPPTLADGLAVFGCRDGYVYCLRATDGELVWRFRAAPDDRRIVAYGQLESLWPVSGSILVNRGTASFAAGRSSFLDGGIRLYRVDLKNGTQFAESTIYTPDPETRRQLRETVYGFNMYGALPDVLAGDDETLFMRQLCFTQDLEPAPAKPHLFSPTGLLDDSWWHRTYWLYGSTFTSGWPGWFQTGNKVPAGRLLAMDDDTVYGFGRRQFANRSRNAGANWAAQEPYHIFAANKQPAPASPPTAAASKPRAKRGRAAAAARAALKWSQEAPVRARALVLADQTLFFAGVPNLGNSSDEAYAAMRGLRGAKVVCVSATDGSRLTEVPINAPPVLDGMAAARGKLYLSSTDGGLVCFGSK